MNETTTSEVIKTQRPKVNVKAPLPPLFRRNGTQGLRHHKTDRVKINRSCDGTLKKRSLFNPCEKTCAWQSSTGSGYGIIEAFRCPGPVLCRFFRYQTDPKDIGEL